MAIKYYSGINIAGNLVPSADSTYNIGAPALRFTNVYADNLYGNLSGSIANLTNSVQINGTTVIDSSRNLSVAYGTFASNISAAHASFSGDININSGYPRINLNDVNSEDDWAIINANGTLELYNVDDDVRALQIDSSNNATFSNNVTIGGTLTVDGTIDLSNANLDIGAADIVFDIDSSTAGARGLIWDFDGDGNGVSSYIGYIRAGGLAGEKMQFNMNAEGSITGSGTIYQFMNGGTDVFTIGADKSINAGNAVFVAPGTGGSTTVSIRHAGSTGSGILDLQSATGPSVIQSDTDLQFKVGGSSLVWFDNADQYVGIGTSTPNSALEVASSVTFSNVDTFGQFVIKSTSGTTGDLLNFGVDSTNSLAFIQANDRGTSSIPLILQRYSGDVGIGVTPSSGYKLDVAGSIRTNSNLVANNVYSGSGTFVFGLSTSLGEYITSVGNDIRFYAGGSAVATIDGDNSRVGIGTTAPAAKLTVKGYGPQNGEIRIEASDDNTSFGILRITGDASTYEKYLIAYNSAHISQANELSLKNTAGDITFHTGTSGGASEKVRIDTNGNVGIGVITPGEKLDVAGNINLSSTTYSYRINGVNVLNVSTTYTKLYNPEGAIGLYIGDSGDRTNYYDNNYHAFRNAGGSSVLAALNSNGYIVGGTSPSAKLTVDGEYAGRGIELKRTGSLTGNAYLRLVGVDTQEALGFSVNNSEKARITYDGKMGVGTSSPNDVVHLKTSTNTEGLTIQRNSTTTGDFAQLSFLPSTLDTATPNIYIRGVRGASFTDGNLTFNTNSTERMRIDGAGNVGIGTTTPTYKLDINGGSLRVIDDNPIVSISDSNSTYRYAGIALQTNGGNWYLSNGESTTTTESHLYITRNTTGTDKRFIFHRDNYYFGVYDNTNTIKAVINSSGDSYFNGGDVGIGTATPTQKLDIEGGFIRLRSPQVGGIYPPTLTFGQITNAYQAGITSSLHVTNKTDSSAGNFYWYRQSNIVMSLVGSNLTVPDITLTGALKGPSTFYIDPSPDDTGEPGGTTTDTGTVVILGDLQVTGTTTTIDSTTLNVGDLNIVLAKDATTAAAANGAGITINGASATMTYNSSDDRFEFNKDVKTSGYYFADTHFRSTDTAATLSTNGAGVVYLRPNAWNSTTGQFTVANSGNVQASGSITTPSRLTASEVVTTVGEVETPRRKRFYVNLSGVSDRWYKIANVNQGNSGITIRGALNNHVESFGTQRVDLTIFGREGDSSGNIEVVGRFEVAYQGVGIRIVQGGLSGSYTTFDVYVKTTQYSQVELDVYIEGDTGKVTWYGSNTYVTTQPSGTVEFDNTATVQGSYVVEDSLIKEVATEDWAASEFVNVTGDTITGDLAISNGQPKLRLKETDTTNVDKELLVSGGTFYLRNINDDNTVGTNIMSVDSSGNASFPGSLTADGITLTNDIITAASFSTASNRFKLVLTQADATTIEASLDDVVLSNAIDTNYVPYVTTAGGNGDTTNAYLSNSFLKINGNTLELDWTISGSPGYYQDRNIKMREQGSFQNQYKEATYDATSITFVDYVSSSDIDIAKIGGTNAGRIRINDSYTLPASDGSSGQVLTTNGSGDLSWSSITAGGKTTYTKTYASLDTTGVAVAGLTTNTNGASALFIFTCFGQGGYQKIVYNCINISGTWTPSKDIDEGSNTYDVVASANGSTITFTFKGRTASQGYTPTVHVEHIGSSLNTTYL